MADPKTLFSGPKKVRTALLCGLAALATLAAVIAYAVHTRPSPGGDLPPSRSEAVSDAPPASPGPDPTQILVGTTPALTIDEARALALADAGVSEEEAEVSREALAQDNGLWVYEFRFRTPSARYEYKLNANTGEVRSLVKEIFAAPVPEGTEQPSDPATPAPPAESAPPVQTTPPAAQASAGAHPGSTYIGADRAKAIALERAGLTADQVTFTHVSMDREDGRMVYELEFRQGRTEHEFEIDAATGRILDYDTDTD